VGYIFVADCIYAYLHSVWRDELRNLAEVMAKDEKDTLRGSTSLKVVKFATNQKGICDFLFGCILHVFGATATYWSKLNRLGHPGLI